MGDLSFREVGDILHLLENIDAAEVDLEWGDLRIQVSRGRTAPTQAPLATPQSAPRTIDASIVPRQAADASTDGSVDTARGVSAAPAAAAPAAAAPAAAAPAAAAPELGWSVVAAPMAGTAYLAPKPGEPPFVEIGTTVSAGDTVALIEIMKLFTELKAEKAGIVARVEPVDGTLVEFDQPIVWIEPA